MLDSDWVSPPGDTISDLLEETGWTQAEFSKRIGYSKKHINLLIQGKVPITEETACRLELVLGGSVSFWLTREAQYREALFKKEGLLEFTSSEYKTWLKELPLSEMIQFGWIQKKSTQAEQVFECLQYFGVANLDAYYKQYESPILAFRGSEKLTKSKYAIAAYLRYGEREAEKSSFLEWNEELLSRLLQKIKNFTIEQDFKKVFNELRTTLRECGIFLVIAPTPKGCPIFGLTKWLNSKQALIMLSLRYKTNDQFWFSLFHELGHLIKHKKKFLYLELGNNTESEIEQEANQFAAEIFIPKEWENKLHTLELSEKAILEFAKELQIHPAIVVGRLQHEGRLSWKTSLNSLKQSLDWKELF